MRVDAGSSESPPNASPENVIGNQPDIPVDKKHSVMTKIMRYILTLLFSTIILFQTDFAQAKKDQAPKSKSDLIIKVDTLKTRTVTDTLKVQISSAPTTSEKNDRPWQIALTVGILAFLATITAAFINRKITLKSIDTNKEIAIKQIQNSQDATIHQFNSTLKTKNRQDWINDVRNSISEFISNSIKINIEFQDPGPDNQQKIKDTHEKITYNRAKLRMMLNPDKTLHNNVLASMDALMEVYDLHNAVYRSKVGTYDNFKFKNAADKLVDDGRILSYNEWQKIQKLTEDKTS